MTKSDIETFPFPLIEQFSDQQRKLILELSNQLLTHISKPWHKINHLIFDLYGLDEYDRQVIKDTLKVAQPFKKSRDLANKAPTSKDRKEFYVELQKFIAPYFIVTNETINIKEFEIPQDFSEVPWHFFAISMGDPVVDDAQSVLNRIIPKFTEEANSLGCSRVIIPNSPELLNKYLVVGIIGQFRYWTLSRARLCAMDIIRNHLDAFPITR